MATISEKLQLVRGRIHAAVSQTARPEGCVALLAVSKTFPAVTVREAMAAGQHRFGENYVQEALDKMAELTDLRDQIEWHMIGPLQSNKTRAAAERGARPAPPAPARRDGPARPHGRRGRAEPPTRRGACRVRTPAVSGSSLGHPVH